MNKEVQKEEVGTNDHVKMAASIEIEKFRIISIGLFEAAMRYREAYYREDIEAFKAGQKLPDETMTKAFSTDRGAKRRYMEKLDLKALTYKNDQERFNKTVYDHINSVTDGMRPTDQIGFDNYATGFGLIMEEFLKAKNTTDLISIMKGFNMGLLDSVIELIKPEKNEKEKSTDEGSGGATIIALDGVSGNGPAPAIISIDGDGYHKPD